MKELIFLIYLFMLNGLVNSSCNCLEECSQPQQGTCPEIKYIDNGLNGTSGLYRLWNCCKPNCASEAQAEKGNQARQCDSYMRRLYDYSATNKCDGGPATTCFSHIPFSIDGCDNIGFGFGSVNSKSDICGRCFLLEFTGEGVWTTKNTHRALKNKKLIFMAINKGNGSDDDNLNFDLFVPGGGSGIHTNGCLGIFSGDLGAKYGGFLADCQDEAGMSDDDKSNTERKKCLIRKCTEAFTGEPREGCLFYAYFLEAAGNPVVTYQEIECPQILKDKY